MGDLGEAIDGFAADALGGAVGVVEFGVFGFEGCEFGEELVEFEIRHEGRGIDVVGAIGAGEEISEVVDALSFSGV
jgi:hypothetical protein